MLKQFKELDQKEAQIRHLSEDSNSHQPNHKDLLIPENFKEFIA